MLYVSCHITADDYGRIIEMFGGTCFDVKAPTTEQEIKELNILVSETMNDTYETRTASAVIIWWKEL